MKTYKIKNINYNKTLIVIDLAKADVLELYKLALSMDIPFAVKREVGVEIWGHAVVANYLGVKDSSKLLS